MKKLVLLLVAFLLAAGVAGAQRPSVEDYNLERRARIALTQNLADYLFLGTVNAELQLSVHRNWTVGLGARYNNWTWRARQDNQFEMRQQTYFVGARWWPWYTYSGWWVGARLQYQEYNRGGIIRQETEEGDAFGLSLGAGYSVHVNRWLNIDFGLYGWGGATKYVTYACPNCGRRTGEGMKAFFLPDDMVVSLMFIF